MLSRLSSLPEKFFSYSSHVAPSKEALDNAISEIKQLGRSPSTNDATLQGITKILSFMKQYSANIEIQKVACHALSNLAMQVVIARWIVEKNGFQLIRRALIKFMDDKKLCWLGSSAVWNLARPPANRTIIGISGVKLMLRMIALHPSDERVINTSIGALSNLSLDPELKDVIAKKNNVQLILGILHKYLNNRSVSVMTSGAGLLANICVSDRHATLLVHNDTLKLILNLLKWQYKSTDDTLYRNTCAAMNNMVTADDFLDYFLESQGVEIIFDFLDNNEQDLYTNLLENCLVNIEVDANTPTTSHHLASMHGRLELLKKILLHKNINCINGKDGKNMTCLDYAISMGHGDVAKFLSKCGAIQYNNDSFKDKNDIKQSMIEGQNILGNAKKKYCSAVFNSLPNDFSHDLCHLIVSYKCNVDMLQSINQY